MNLSSTHRMYFIAIMCPRELDMKVLSFKNWMKVQFGSVAALKSPAHITLIQPFWLGEDKEIALRNFFQGFTSDMDELEIQLDGFSHFGKRVLYIRVKEDPSLEELKNQVQNNFALSFAGFIKKDDRPFHPHVTIASRDMKPGDFEKAWLHFSNKSFKDVFSIQFISLLKLTEGKWKVMDEKKWQMNQ